MGREIKRVPLDFQWPLHTVWSGFRMPPALQLPECPACTGDGYSVEARAIAETFYPHQIDGPNAQRLAWGDKLGQAEVDHLVGKGRLRDLHTRQPSEDNPRAWEWVSEPRTAADVNAAQRRGGLGSHDAINRGLLVAFRCDRLGIVVECPRCLGHGDLGTDAQRQAREDWTGHEPPTGEGWQIWETVSEGSPVSPVFPTQAALIAALIADGHSEQAARNFAAHGWVLSAIIIGGVVKSDIDACEDFAPTS
jgi:hypothetical protein